MKKALYKIGITGGIASGKSKLVNYLSKIPRIYTINLDQRGIDIYSLNPIITKNVEQIFGSDTVIKDQDDNQTIKSINRTALGSVVFSDDYNIRTLRSIVSPEIKRLMKDEFNEVEYKYQDLYDVIVVEGAVLVEAKTYRFFDELWVTTLPKEYAVRRILQRNPELSEDLARQRVERQIDDNERLKYASFSYETIKNFEENIPLVDEKLKQLREKGILH